MIACHTSRAPATPADATLVHQLLQCTPHSTRRGRIKRRRHRHLRTKTPALPATLTDTIILQRYRITAIPSASPQHRRRVYYSTHAFRSFSVVRHACRCRLPQCPQLTLAIRPSVRPSVLPFIRPPALNSLSYCAVRSFVRSFVRLFVRSFVLNCHTVVVVVVVADSQ